MRLNVLDFEAKLDSEIDGEVPAGFHAFRDGLTLRTETQSFDEDGEPCVLMSWQVRYRVGPSHLRIAHFTYTIETALLETKQSQYEQSVVQTILKLSEFGRKPGETGDYYH